LQASGNVLLLQGDLNSQQWMEARSGRRSKKAAGKRKTMFRWIGHILPRNVSGIMARRYRPERHYMRGCGPACAARHAAAKRSLGQTV
jgi:hypothetical protein